ncbi:MAG: hypothetical protein FWB96_04925 [Defluviitaleaceae bacterium]|nr:hypothetical protein [Defluviitaleaceae bacterium]MCL2262222.1 hypothetical protein [Defluviitaleaceae bacterium]
MNCEWSGQVKFHPWVGENFWNAPRKVLLLGDSHYGDGDAFEGFTQDVIKYFCFEKKKRLRFFTGIIWTLFGDSENLEDKFGKVAFYNYVQELMSATRVRPSRADYEAAQKPLIEVLEKLSPDFMVTFGKEMTWHFPEISEHPDWKLDIAGERHEVWKNVFVVGNRVIPVYSLPHPCGNKFNMSVYFRYFHEQGLALKGTVKE